MHSAAWAITQQLLRQAMAAVFMLALTNKVTPMELGLVAIANVWNSFLALFLELGFGAALIQRKEVTATHLASVLLVNIICGVALMLFSMGASWPVSMVMKAPGAQPVIFVMSVSFLITALASVQNAMAQRELRFRTLAARDFAASSIAAIVGIVLVFRGYGVWAVVANSLLTNLLGAIFIWRVTPHRIVLGEARWSAAKELWQFGSKVFGYAVLKHVVRNTDSIVVGAIFGPDKLGLYNLSQRITMAPTKGIQSGVSAFLFPKASQVQDDLKRLRELYLLAYKSLNVLILAFILLLGTVGVELIPLVFGRQWEGARGLVRVLMFILFLAPALGPVGELMKATNRPGWLIKWLVMMMALNTGGLALGIWFGFKGSIIGLIASYWLAMPVVAWIVHQMTGLTFAEFWNRMRTGYLIAAVVGALGYLAWREWHENLPTLGGVMVGLAAIQLVATYWLDSDLQRLFANILRKRLGRPAAPLVAETKA